MGMLLRLDDSRFARGDGLMLEHIDRPVPARLGLGARPLLVVLEPCLGPARLDLQLVDSVLNGRTSASLFWAVALTSKSLPLTEMSAT